MSKREHKRLNDAALIGALERAYSAFNAREIDAALDLMHPDVVWANGMDGGVVVGHEAVREYWTRQWSMIGPHVEPVGFADEDGRVVVTVRQEVRDLTGKVLSEATVRHVYEIRDGVIRSMEIRS